MGMKRFTQLYEGIDCLIDTFREREVDELGSIRFRVGFRTGGGAAWST